MQKSGIGKVYVTLNFIRNRFVKLCEAHEESDN